MTLFHRGMLVLAVICTVLGAAGCAPVVSELKAARHPGGLGLHERLSQSIHDNGFTHGIRSIRSDDREIDTIFVSIPLDALKRQYITLHHMLFNVARLCARPEYAHLSIQIELNAADEVDRNYMRGIVGPIVAEARNVTVSSQSDVTNDLVITLSNAAAKTAAKPAGAAQKP